MAADYLPPAYYRLIKDGLIGRLEDSQREKKQELGFQHWQNETVFPAAVNRWLSDIGEETR